MQIHPLVLVSTSFIRKQILQGAGIEFTSCKPNLDEDLVKQENPDLDPSALALCLAKAKVLANSYPPGTLVLGADQILEIDQRSMDKVHTIEQAKERLWNLRGRTHYLTGACVLAQNGKIIWKHQHRAELKMRTFSKSALDEYLKNAGERILYSVGCYELEAEGITLFSSIKGEYTAMLGLALLPVLQALRKFGGLQQ